MRKLLFAAFALAIAGSLPAQSPLVLPFAADDAGPVGGCVCFDLDVLSTITIDRLDVNTLSLPGTPGTLRVWLGPSTWTEHAQDASWWVVAADGALVAADLDTPTPCTLTQPLTLGPGSYGIVLEHQGIAPAHTIGTGANELAGNAELQFRAGGATPLPFAAALRPRVWNGAIHYAPGGTPLPLAVAAPYGVGCNAVQCSFCEEFAALPFARSFDLDNTTLRLQPNARGGYDVTRTAGAAIVPPGVPALAMGDDTISIEYVPFAFPFPGGSTSNLWVCSNGFVGFEPFAVADFSPSEAEMLAQGARLLPAWLDLNPGAVGSGGIHYEIDPSNTFVTITWNNVWQYGTAGTAPNRFQVVLRDSGAIEIRYGTVRNYAAPCLVGWTTGNGNLGLPPVECDLSRTAPLALGFQQPLALAIGPRPVLGATLALATSAIPSTALASTNVLSYAPLLGGVDLTPRGAPGCRQYCGADAPVLLFGSGTQLRSLGPIPLDPIWIGLEIFSQSASLVPGSNALGLVTSNGVRLRIGGI